MAKRYLLARHDPGKWTLTQYFRASDNSWTVDERDASKYHEDDLRPILQDVREQFKDAHIWTVEA